MEANRRKAREKLTFDSLSDYQELLGKSKLTLQEREICDYRYLNGLSFAEIAIKLGCSVDGIYKKHKRILNKIIKSI